MSCECGTQPGLLACLRARVACGACSPLLHSGFGLVSPSTRACPPHPSMAAVCMCMCLLLLPCHASSPSCPSDITSVPPHHLSPCGHASAPSCPSDMSAPSPPVSLLQHGLLPGSGHWRHPGARVVSHLSCLASLVHPRCCNPVLSSLSVTVVLKLPRLLLRFPAQAGPTTSALLYSCTRLHSGCMP